MLGTHGVPANYGGFETAAERVGLYLRDRGWRVIVYTQVKGLGSITEDTWNGLERVLVPTMREGWHGTSEFDLKSVLHASRHSDLCLTFGYNTAIFNVMQRVRRIPNVINMDGIEWQRAKWGALERLLFRFNERVGLMVGNELIADHPVIEQYLATKVRRSKITTITYGADAVMTAPTLPVTSRGLTPGGYLTLICRPVPENSILELVTAFSREERGHTLAVLGNYSPQSDEYHRAVRNAASAEVEFLGGIYDPAELASVRFHASGYLHGHTVGGTNPSLVEALGAGNAILAHDNPYNRWVAAAGAIYFTSTDDAAAGISTILTDLPTRARLAKASRRRHAEEFTWEHIGGQYEELLERHVVSRDRADI
jgi:glycosyltransferase involved in cell wall biosynthesis